MILQVEHPVTQPTCVKTVPRIDAYKTGAVQDPADKEDGARAPIALAGMRKSADSDHGET